MPGVLYFAYKYFDTPEHGVIANADMAGDNVNRGMVLGAVLGVCHGSRAWTAALVDGLHQAESAKAEAEAFARFAASKTVSRGCVTVDYAENPIDALLLPLVGKGGLSGLGGVCDSAAAPPPPPSVGSGATDAPAEADGPVCRLVRGADGKRKRA